MRRALVAAAAALAVLGVSACGDEPKSTVTVRELCDEVDQLVRDGESPGDALLNVGLFHGLSPSDFGKLDCLTRGG